MTENLTMPGDFERVFQFATVAHWRSCSMRYVYVFRNIYERNEPDEAYSFQEAQGIKRFDSHLSPV
jgi:hypothetical protein